MKGRMQVIVTHFLCFIVIFKRSDLKCHQHAIQPFICQIFNCFKIVNFNKKTSICNFCTINVHSLWNNKPLK